MAWVVAAAALAVPPAALGEQTKAATGKFWVSPGGDDRAPGTKSAPFKTLQRAKRAVREALARRPDRDYAVILDGGVYRLSKPLRLTARDSAAGGHTVVYRARSGERPILSGAESVPAAAWSRYDAQHDIWRARVGTVATRELYVNGERATRATTGTYPAGFRPTWSDGGPGSGIEYVPTIQPDGLNPPGWGDPATWKNVDDIEAVILTQWKTMSVPLRSIAPAGPSTPGLLRMAEPAWTNANVFRDPDTGQPGLWSFWQVTRFENAYRFLDTPGEWYLDSERGWLYYMPHAWESMKSADVELPTLETLVEGHGTASKPVQNIEFRGLTFSHATWLQPSGDNGYVSDQAGFHLTGRGHQPNVIGHDPDDEATPGNVTFRFDRGIRFVNDRFRHLGAVGLSLGTGSQDSLVRGNRFADIGSSAIQLGGIAAIDHHPARGSQMTRDNVISRNLVDDVARGYPDAPGIFAGFTRNTRIANNTVRNVPWTGIAMGWGWGLLDPGGFPGLPGAEQYQWGRYDTPTPSRGSVVAHNTITDFLQTLWDGGAIYTTGFQGTSPDNGLVIKDNTAFDKRPAAGGNTFYTDGGSRFITVEGNTSHDDPIGVTDFGPPPSPADPLPYPSAPSDGDGVPYGSDIGGCVTYGDIRYLRNSWFEAPMQTDMALGNDFYSLITGGRLKPWSDAGFFDVCPYTDAQGVSHPTDLSFSGNVVYPAKP